MNEKTALVSVVGRPNVGKSSLVNALVGEKVSIVTNKAQTTRNRITGIFTEEEYQFVFWDTPGLNRGKNNLDSHMRKIVRSSLSGVDLVLLMVEPIANIGKQEDEIIKTLKYSEAKAVLLINKIDTIEKNSLFPIISKYSEAYDFEAILPISVLKGDGLSELKSLLKSCAQEGKHIFSADMYTDQAEKQICAELLREKMLFNLDKEIPHGTAVEIIYFKERDDGVVDINATVYCEKKSHKGIIIGKNGSMLKKISTDARLDMEELLGTKVFLEVWVKVSENWRDSSFLINQLKI